jgi:acetolactate synthase-1/3 small subunit
MTDTFILQIDCAEGSLQRLIGVIERRGFHIDRMSVNDSGSCREVRLRLRGRDASRCVDVLGRQLDRLIGVRRLGSTAPSFVPVEEAVPCPA